MADKIFEGLWDCPYCGQKGIGGLVKSCPNCAHPQDAGTKFYMGSQKNQLDEEKAKDYGKGADWTCAFCGSMNRYGETNCVNCGAERADSSGDYFENRKKEAAAAAAPKPEPVPQPRPPKPGGRKGLKILGVILAALVLFFIIRAIPRDKGVTVQDKAWERSIAYETYQVVREQDWGLPEGAELVDSGRAVRYYEEVFDHYDTEEYDVSEEVLDGYDTYVDYVDNGDGTFTEVENEVPRYRTEWHTETRQVKVYRKEPVYETLYTYDIGRWLPEMEPATARGSCWQPSNELNRMGGSWQVSEPYWPEDRLSDDSREVTRWASYYLILADKKGNSYTVTVPEEIWNRYSQNDSVEIKANAAGTVTEIDGQSW